MFIFWFSSYELAHDSCFLLHYTLATGLWSSIPSLEKNGWEVPSVLWLSMIHMISYASILLYMWNLKVCIILYPWHLENPRNICPSSLHPNWLGHFHHAAQACWRSTWSSKISSDVTTCDYWTTQTSELGWNYPTQSTWLKFFTATIKRSHWARIQFNDMIWINWWLILIFKILRF